MTGAAGTVDLQRLRRALLDEPSHGRADALKPAAVLFPIVLRGEQSSVLLTRRTDQLKDHPGQISFPGGRVEPDDRSPAHTALREAEEEIGLSPTQVEVIGYLPDYRTVTGYRITPVVAFVQAPLTLTPDPHEVAGVFEVPLAFLLDTRNHRQQTIDSPMGVRQTVSMPYDGHNIWGATASMIVSLCRALADRDQQA